jgi:pyruvate dehydrogenase E2 component (dihydrolipoamide acetyltransferase)
MATEVILPRVDMDMAEGKISRWFVEEGQSVAKGQPIFEIETDKAAMEVEAPTSGIIRGLSPDLAAALPVGSVVAWIEGENEDASPERRPSLSVAEGKSPLSEGGKSGTRANAPGSTDIESRDLNSQAEGQGAGASPAEPDTGTAPRATPLARRLARERGVDLGGLIGSGPKGRIQAADIGARAKDEIAPAIGAVAHGKLHRLWLRRAEGTPLVFVHGFGADLNGWRPLIRNVKAARSFLALDLPGHGNSPLAGETNLEAIVDAVEMALIEEGLRDAHLIGHSLGGAVAIALAGRRPVRARSLTLIAPAGLGPDINGDFLSGFLRAQSEPSLAPWIRLLATDNGALGSALVKTTLRQRRDYGVAAAQSRIAADLFPDGTQAFNMREALARYDGPVKVIFGLDDHIIPARHARGLSGVVALHLFSGVGHMPHLEARDEVARLIDDNIAAGD